MFSFCANCVIKRLEILKLLLISTAPYVCVQWGLDKYSKNTFCTRCSTRLLLFTKSQFFWIYPTQTKC